MKSCRLNISLRWSEVQNFYWLAMTSSVHYYDPTISEIILINQPTKVRSTVRLAVTIDTLLNNYKLIIIIFLLIWIWHWATQYVHTNLEFEKPHLTPKHRAWLMNVLSLAVDRYYYFDLSCARWIADWLYAKTLEEVYCVWYLNYH